MAKIGRPRKEFPFSVARMRELGRNCASEAMIADMANMGETTLRARMMENPSLYEAYKAGRAERGEELVTRLMALAAGQIDATRAQAAALFFYAKTQLGWRETTRTELTGADGGPIATQHAESPRARILDAADQFAARRRAAKTA